MTTMKPPSARASMVEFRSLLLPPIRVPARSFLSLWRPRYSPDGQHDERRQQCFVQRRYLCLYKTARAKTVLGQHKVLPFSLYKVAPPSASKHRVNVRDGHIVKKNISLQELYDNHVKPGRMLYPMRDIGKSQVGSVEKLKRANLQEEYNVYNVLEAFSIPGNNKNPTAGKGIGALRVAPLSLSSPGDYFRLAIDRSYQFIYHGSPVEFIIRYSSAGGGAGKKAEKLKPGNTDAWPWVCDHFPHLRPDFILKSMPEGSRYVVEPVSDGRVMQFVINRPNKLLENIVNYTKRLFKVKNSVEASLTRGKQAGLPKALRQDLVNAGDENYSPVTDMPLAYVKQHGEDAGNKLSLSRQEKEHWSMGRTVKKNKMIRARTEKAIRDTLDESGGFRYQRRPEQPEQETSEGSAGSTSA